MINSSSTWNIPSLDFRNSNFSSAMNNSGNVAAYNNSAVLNTPLGRGSTSPAPPIPPRPVRNTYNSGYNSYSSPYNSYMRGGYMSPFNNYGGYGGYGSYGGFGSYGFGSFRPSLGSYNSSYPENRFIQIAEESSRPAFQSIQSVLQAFSSVTMMFESSFHAIYSSYMSVLEVADNFAKLQNAFGQIFSTLAVIRALNWIYKKLMKLLGINKNNLIEESIWLNALKETSTLENQKKNKRKTWPLLLFTTILIGGPYLLFKLISEFNPQPLQEKWVPAVHPGSLAVGLYDFYAASEFELSITPQQKLIIAPKKFQPTDCPGWLLACNESKKIGLIPQNYVGLLMQSEKTGQTYIEHNGHTYQQNSNINIGKDLQENVQTGEVREESKVDKTAEETNNHKG